MKNNTSTNSQLRQNTFYFQQVDQVLVNLYSPAIPKHLGMESSTKPRDHNVKSENAKATLTGSPESLYLDYLSTFQYKVSVFLIVVNLNHAE